MRKLLVVRPGMSGGAMPTVPSTTNITMQSKISIPDQPSTITTSNVGNMQSNREIKASINL